MKEHASSMFGGLPSELKHYFHEYQKEFQNYSALSTKRELLLEVLKSDVIFFGDYHTLSQAQRTVIRILRDSIRVLKRNKKRVVLALEMLTPQHDAFVKKFLQGKISERVFLESIGFEENWGFPWDHYKPLFEFAREHGVEVRGINHPKSSKKMSLKLRDQFSAKVLSDISVSDPNTSIFVLIGDLHLAGKHLPHEFKTKLKLKKSSRKILSVHQNLEKLYWQLVEQGLEHWVDVVRIGKRDFCVMNTPPWVKLKSHLNWTELIAEAGKVPPLATAAQAFEEMDYSHEVADLTRMIGHFLGMKIPHLDNFQIYGPLDFELLKNDPLNSKYARVFKSYFVPKKNMIFLNSLSLNHVAAQSSIFLHSILSGFVNVFENPHRDFYSFIWVEALGFLGAKVINPKRKCNGRLDLRKQLGRARATKKDENWQSAYLALTHLEWERASIQNRNSVALLLPQSSNRNLLYYKTAKILGHLLGNSIYHALVDQKISREEVKELFYQCFDQAHAASEAYFKWAKRLDQFNYRDSVKWQRF
ncbi:MAG: ChaN family lipoprotein [Deltaproteobacteria bacterium]